MRGVDEAPAPPTVEADPEITAEPELTKIVVLPFENLGAAEDEYFAAGMTEEISARLASVADLGVISRSSAIQYDRSGKTLRQVGEDLGVGYVLEGTVRWAKSPDGTSRVRITPQLTRTTDDTQLWAETYDRTLEDIFEVQSEVAGAVLESLDLQLIAAEGPVGERPPTENMEAYSLYLRGANVAERAELLQDFELQFEAVEWLEQAVEKDPEFALAWAMLSEEQARLFFNGADRTEERLEMSRRAVDRALEIDPDLPRAHMALGHYYYWGPRDYEQALEHLAIAERNLPNDPELMASIAYIRRRQGHLEEAAERLEKAVELNPKSITQNRALGTTYLTLGRFEEADRQLGQLVATNPDAIAARVWWAHTWFMWKGDGRGAIERLEPVLALGIEELKPNKALYLTASRDFEGALAVFDTMEEEFYPTQFRAQSVSLERALALWALGREEESQEAATRAAKALEEQVLVNPDDPRMHGSLAIAYALLGREDEARREAERAVKLQPMEMDFMEGAGRLFESVLTYSILGDEERTLELLDQLLASNNGWMSVPAMEANQVLDFLRDHPGYRELVKKYS